MPSARLSLTSLGAGSLQGLHARRAGKRPQSSDKLVVGMRLDLKYVLETLRAHETELRRLGVAHAAVFGSVARGEERAESDIDVLVELDENRPIGIFEYARLKLYINELLDGPSDVVNRRTLKPLLQASILHDMVHAF
jgi:predicted nucleotidyltransferase